MSIFVENSEALTAYRAAAAELHEFSFGVEKKLEEAGESGELTEAKALLSELSLRTKAFEDLRPTLSPVDLFIAKYGVVAHDEHTISFVIPQGVSRIEILKEAQNISIEMHETNPEKYEANQAILPERLTKWASMEEFKEATEKTLSLKIYGNVEGSTNMTREEQEDKGWNNVTLKIWQ